MPGNAFGQAFRFTTWGESHGPAIGCVVDGVPPLIPLAEADIQAWLDKPPAGPVALHHPAPRAGQVKILSGVFEGVTTGTPVSLMIEKRRPAQQGLRRHQGQVPAGPRRLHLHGPSTACATTAAAAAPAPARPRCGSRAGAVARKVLDHLLGVRIRGALVQMGPHAIERDRLGLGRRSSRTPSGAPTPQAAAALGQLPGRRAQGRLLGRRGDRGGRRGRAGRAWASRSTTSWTPTWPRP